MTGATGGAGSASGTAAELVPLGEPAGRTRWEIAHDGRGFVVLAHEGGYVVFDALCPHRAGRLVHGLIRDGAVVCPAHWYAFDLHSGDCRTTDRHRLGTYRVVVRDGLVCAEIPPARTRSWSQLLREHAAGGTGPASRNIGTAGAAAGGMMTPVVQARGLLLDIGGVVLRNAATLMSLLAATDERLANEIDRLGLATDRDALWHAMLAHEVTERAYWARRAADLGAVLGESWDTRAMINRIYERPPAEWLVAEVNRLMRDTKDAGLPLGALTNDLEDFHGRDWVARQDWLRLFDVVIDASTTGVLKPDPRAFAAGAAALGLAPGEIVYLDDMPWNVAGGITAGLQTVQVSLTDPGPAVAEARRRLGLPPDGSPGDGPNDPMDPNDPNRTEGT